MRLSDIYLFLPKISGDPIIDGFIYIVATGLVIWGLYELHWHMKYRWEYSSIKSDKGVVTDMQYTPPRTTTTFNGKTTTTSTTPAKHRVYIKFEQMGNLDFNHTKLYETVRMDDNVTSTYQEVYRVERQDPTKRVFDHYNVINITSEKGRVVAV